MLPLLRVLAMVPMFLAMKVRREERRLVQGHLDRGALSHDHVARVDSDGRVATWVRDRLVRNDALKLTPEGSYLDETAYSAYRWRRRRRALVMVTLVLLGFGIAFFKGDVTL